MSKGNDTYYYQDGKRKTGWVTLDGKKYYFDKATGKMAVGRYKVKKKTYYFNGKGVLQRELSGVGWVTTAKGCRYSNGDGTYCKGWKTIQGKRYWFSKKGYAAKGWKKIKGEYYYFDKEYVKVTKKKIKTKGSVYYVDAEGKRVASKWVGKRYYGADGKWIRNYIDETRTSKDKTGWVGFGRLWKYYVNGKNVTGWKTLRGNRYFFQPDGYVKMGWHFEGKFYYFLSTDVDHVGIMCTGWRKIDGKYYYFFPKKKKVSGITFKKGTMARGITIRSSSTGKAYTFNNAGVCTNY